MSKTSIPFSAGDISALARALRHQLTASGHTPGHLELLNMLARSTGHRNFQSLRAQSAAQAKLETPVPEPVDFIQVKRQAGYFDARGRLVRWPGKSNLQEACLWVLWSKLPPRQPLAEDDLNRLLRAYHLFGDHALLRRELCDHGLVARTSDGREYRRVERRPPPDAAALIHYVSAREPGRTQ
jgi:hypothetical protein